MKKKINKYGLPTSPGLVGKKVYIRPMEPEDVELSYQWHLSSDPHSQTCRQTKLVTPSEAVNRFRQREFSLNEGDFMIIAIDEEHPVGKLRYFSLNMLNRSAELGVIVAPEDRENGYAKEGMKLLIGYLFQYLNLNKVYAQTATFNKSSIKLLESLDFKQDGTLRQHHYYKGDLYDDIVFSLLKFECSFLGE